MSAIVFPNDIGKIRVLIGVQWFSSRRWWQILRGRIGPTHHYNLKKEELVWLIVRSTTAKRFMIYLSISCVPRNPPD